MDNRLMDPVYRSGGRPGSEEWWKEREGEGAFRKNRDLSWKDVAVSLVGVILTVGGFLACQFVVMKLPHTKVCGFFLFAAILRHPRRMAGMLNNMKEVIFVVPA